MRKRRFQTGSVFPRFSKRRNAWSWVGRYLEPTLVNNQLKTVLRSVTIGPCMNPKSAEERKQAQFKLQDLYLRDLNEGHSLPTEAVDFKTFHAKWESTWLPSYRDSTAKFYRDTAKSWVLPYFSTSKLEDLSPIVLQEYLNLCAKKFSRSVLKHLRATLNCLFNAAVSWHYLKESPSKGLRLPPGKPVQQAHVLTLNQIAQLVQQLLSPYRDMVLLAGATGLRPSELWGLQWQDLDMASQLVHVRRRVYRRHVGETKTPQSVRDVPVAEAVLAALEPRRGSPDEFVFHGERGGAIRGDEILSKYIRPVAARLQLPHLTWESFRRSAATALHQAVPLKVQAAMLGHSAEVSLKVYTEVSDAGKREAAQVLGQVVFPTFPQSGVLRPN
jgi:integrase